MSVYHWADKEMLRRLMDAQLLNNTLRGSTTLLTADTECTSLDSTGRTLPVLKAMFGHAEKILIWLSAFGINGDLINHIAVIDAIHWLVVNSRKLLGIVSNESTEKWNSGMVKERILEQTIYSCGWGDWRKQMAASWDITEIPLISKASNCLAKRSFRDRKRIQASEKQFKFSGFS